MIEAGTILQNRYRVDKQIGQGGMGNVYVATDERFKSTVAIKETIFEDQNLRRAFEREAKLLNSLKHSALPRVSDHFDEKNGQFLVMEFISGEDLAERMEKNGEAFPLETVLNWAYQLCDALEYLHAQDIIHRDIKPQNLKLTTNNQIVLLDFGLAKGNPTDSNNQTAAKSIFGFSRNYASLEQIQGAGTEPRSDLYSLAATIYHLLTGIPPADALTRAMNVLNKKSDPLIAANLVNRQVPKAVADVLQKAMALDANERPATAAAMRKSLEESDKTVDLFAVGAITDDLLSEEFLTQETKIIGAPTNIVQNAESEVKTRIAAKDVTAEKSYKTTVADEKSDEPETVVRQFSAANVAPKRSKALFVIPIFGGLLLLLCFVAFATLFQDSDSPVNVGAENPNGENNTNSSAVKIENVVVPNANVADANAIVADKENNVNPETQPIEATKNAAKDAKKQTTNTQTAAKSDRKNAGSDEMIVNQETGTVQMGDVIIDEKGIRDRKTGKSIMAIPEEPEEPNAPSAPPQNLSPEQLRRLENLRERMKSRKNRVIIMKTPTPPKSPEN